MARNKNKLKNGLIGFNSIQVDNYIDHIKKDHEEKISQKLNIIKELEKSNSDLKEKISKLKSEMNSQKQSEEIITFAIKKAEEWADELLEISNRKVNEFRQFAKDEEILMNKKIEAYKKLLKDSKDKLNLLLNTEIQRNTELIEEINKSIDDKNKTINNEDKFINDNIINYSNILEGRNSRKDNDEKTSKINSLSNEKEEDKLDIDTQKAVNETGLDFQTNKGMQDKPVEVVKQCKADKTTENRESEKFIEKNIIEEDEVAIASESIDAELDNVKFISSFDENINDLNEFDNLKDEIINVTDEEKGELIDSNYLNKVPVGNSFWGDDFNEGLFDIPSDKKSCSTEVVNELSGVEDNYDIASDLHIGEINLGKEIDFEKEINPEKEVSQEIRNDNFQEKDEWLGKEGKAVERKDQSSSAINGEIENIRIKYIAGKIAGEDLFGRNGALIIRKGEVITINTIESAEKHGQLANLIMDMKLPEGS